MAYASKSGRARTRASQPQAFGVCMRCGIWYNRVELKNQFAWRGAALLPTWVFVCPTCMDVPQEQDRAIVLGPDPIPVQLALPEDFRVATSVMGLAATGEVDPITGLPVPPTTRMGTTDGITMAPTPTGRPPGYDALIDMTPDTQLGPEPPDDGEPPLPQGVPIPIVSVLADGTPLVRVTCRGPHGLVLNSQIFVRGSGNPLADGAFSIIPLTATVFTYGTYSPIPAGSLIEPETVVVATQIGLPRDFPALPQTGLQQSVIPTKTSQ